MGNCQAIDAAVLVIQYPSGREERLYWPVTAHQVMKTNPGHYVSLIIPLPPTHDVVSQQPNNNTNAPVDANKAVRYTRVKLLRPTDTLVLGRAYRLITSQEVMKVLRAKKHAEMKKYQPAEGLPAAPEPQQKHRAGGEMEARRSGRSERTHLEVKQERRRPKMTAVTSPTAAKSKSWRPSLQSITEAAT